MAGVEKRRPSRLPLPIKLRQTRPSSVFSLKPLSMKNNTQSSDTLRGYLLTLVVVVAFSMYPSVTPVALASGASPVTFVLLAMVVSLIGTVGVSVLRGERLLPLRSEVSECVALGALLFCEHALLAYSLLYLKVPVAMSVVYTYPFMIGIVAVMRGSAPATLSLFVSLVACFIVSHSSLDSRWMS